MIGRRHGHPVKRLLTLDAIAAVEAKLGVPVVSRSPAGFWDVMRVAALDSESRQGGRLFRGW